MLLSSAWIDHQNGEKRPFSLLLLQRNNEENIPNDKSKHQTNSVL